MNLEQFAVILEAASFMLVTTDLYGKERLRNLHTKVGKAITHLEELDRTSPGKYIFKLFGWLLDVYVIDIGEKIRWSFLRVFNGVVLVIVFFGITSYMAVFVMEWLGRSMWELKNLVYFFFTVLGISGIILMLPMTIFILLFGLEGIIVIALTIALTIALFFLEKLNLEGVMLIVGSILFMISKAISFRNLSS